MDTYKRKKQPKYVEGFYKDFLEVDMPFEDAEWALYLINNYPFKDNDDWVLQVAEGLDQIAYTDAKYKAFYKQEYKLEAENIFAAIKFLKTHKKEYSFKKRKFPWSLDVIDKHNGRSFYLSMYESYTTFPLYRLFYQYPNSSEWDQETIDWATHDNGYNGISAKYYKEPGEESYLFFNHYQLCVSPEVFDKQFQTSLALFNRFIDQAESSMEYYWKNHNK